MEWVQVVIGILEIVAIIILGLFLKNYFPSYMDEKGKNLATKEDIAEITRKTEVVQQGNTKTIAMMRVFGYDDTTCSRCILGAYRPISYIGFAFGTVYQYGLLRMMVSVVFADIENMPEYGFDFKALTVTLILFVLTYELVMYLYSRSIKRLSVKSVMLE